MGQEYYDQLTLAHGAGGFAGDIRQCVARAAPTRAAAAAGAAAAGARLGIRSGHKHTSGALPLGWCRRWRVR